MENNKKGFVLFVHFRDPFTHLGGSESVIRSHYKILKENGYDVYVLFPIYKKIKIKKMEIALHAWGLLHENRLLTVTNVNGMKRQIGRLVSQNECYGVFIHSLIFSNLEELRFLISFRKEVVLYLHDYSTCCSQYTLMKNDESYCGNARLYEDKCGSCKYYANGRILKENMKLFFSKIPKLYVISPSKCLAENWLEAFPEYKNNIQVIGHKKCVGEYLENRKILQNDEKIRVAFVGKAVKIKGFDFWIGAVNQISARLDKFEFLFFGHNPIDNPNVKCVNVSIVRDGVDAMIKALRKNRVHIAFLFSICPETYSLTYYECMASNCYVVTSKLSGNIEKEIEKNKNGIVLDASREAIISFLGDGDTVMKLVNDFRSNGLIGPDHIIDNDDFLKLLKMESIEKFDDVKFTEKNVIETCVANIAYRVRYRQFW